MKILYLGCFDGALLDFTKEDGWCAYGVDFLEGAVKKAQEKHGDNVQVGNLESFAVGEPGTFDVVTALDVIEHMLSPQKVLDIALSALKSNSLLVLLTPETFSWPCVLLRRYWPCYEAPEHVHYFSRKSLGLMLKRNGFHSIAFACHIKHLPAAYVMEQMKFWGAELHGKIKRLFPLIPNWIRQRQWPFYGGEMLVFARKNGG